MLLVPSIAAESLMLQVPSSICFFAVILMVCVTKVAKDALRKALAEHGGDMNEAVAALPELTVTDDALTDLNEPLLIKIDAQQPQDQVNHSH